MYRYETHMHTTPVSKCARANVRDSLELYKSLGYAGIFMTNHFLDGNINIDRALPFDERINFYFSDYEEGKKIGAEIGLDILLGVEISYCGTDFLIYGLNKEWWRNHPELEGMEKSQQLPILMKAGALVIQAHPYREASYIDHIRLYPRHVHGVEIINASSDDFYNQLATHYAQAFDLLTIAGSDNHLGKQCKRLAGMEFDTPLKNEQDFVQRILRKEGHIFTLINR